MTEILKQKNSLDLNVDLVLETPSEKGKRRLLTALATFFEEDQEQEAKANAVVDWIENN